MWFDKHLDRHIPKALLCLLTVIAVVGFTWTFPAGARSQESKAMLAVIEADGNLSVYDQAGRNPIRVTRDALPGVRLYQWPTWSTDGRLAFFGASNDPVDSYSLRVFVAEQITSNPAYQTAFSSAEDIFTYPYWSPGNCGAAGENCRDLALLYTPTNGQGLAVRMIRDQAGSFTDRVLGQAAPFYYSFSPDGRQMVWARDGKTIELYDVEADLPRTLKDRPGKFNSPMWSPLDNRILFGVKAGDPDLTNVVIAEGDTRRVLLRDQEAPISFAWSPDTKTVASMAAFGKLVIMDVASGTKLSQSSQTNVVAHFWAPTSDKVAYFVVNRTDPEPQARLHVNGKMPAEQATGGLTLYILDIRTGNSNAVATFNPTRELIYMLNFFDQFAHSHQLWSPDGQYVAYGAVDSKGAPTLYIADTTKPSSPIKVTNGGIGVWRWK